MARLTRIGRAFRWADQLRAAGVDGRQREEGRLAESARIKRSATRTPASIAGPVGHGWPRAGWRRGGPGALFAGAL
jgi:hypothetical protein